ncbi:hypothetical protein [Caminicella sporogenes]|uniref:hypothetical protein n=1 Tax=Caminicella sporogenes TaxID=166485 RepID=UPI000934EDC9|nr:hypothetical protein [Caminicella sporogenes]RKD21937.1 hypothetical protein BET04_06715 [Caminicella sporogenes]
MKKKVNLFIFSFKSNKLFNILIFISIFFLIENFLGECLEPLYRFKFYPEIRWNDFYTSEKEIDLLFLGSSHAYRSFDSEIFDKKLKVNSFNIGSSSQNPIDSYYVLNEVLRYKKPRMVVYEIYWKVFEGDDFNFISATNNYDFMKFSLNKLRYLMNAFKMNQYLKANLLSIRYHKNWKKPEVIKENIKNKYIHKKLPDVHQKENEEFYKDKGFVASEKVVSIEKLNQKNQFNNYNGYSINEKRFHYFEKVITLCKKNDIELILVTTPLPFNSIKKIYDYEEIHKIFAQKAKEEGIDYLDYNLIDRDQLNFKDQFFKDDNHLNFEGAKLISNHLSKYILAKFRNQKYDYNNEFYFSMKEFYLYLVNKIIATSSFRDVYLIDIPKEIEENIKPINNKVFKKSYSSYLSEDKLINDIKKLDEEFDNKDVVLIKMTNRNSQLLKDVLMKLYKFYYKYMDYYIFFNDYDIRLDKYNNILPKYESHFENWEDIGTLKSTELNRVIPPLKLQGIRGGFYFSRVPYEQGNIIQIVPEHNSEKNVVQFGYSLDSNGVNVEVNSGQTVTFIISARCSNIDTANIFIQDYNGKWERIFVSINEFGWKDYIVQKKIRPGIEKVYLGIVWKPKTQGEWLEMKYPRIYVEESSN